MSALLVGYPRCSTDQQNLTAQRDALRSLGVEPERIYVDHGVIGRLAPVDVETGRFGPNLEAQKRSGSARSQSASHGCGTSANSSPGASQSYSCA